MKRILEFAGDLKFAFWLILSAGAIMWIGSIYASANYMLIYSLNGVPLIEWFTTTGMENISVTWWIPAMFFIFTLLGINVFACTINRIMILLPRRKIIGTKRFLVLISPSLIHILFLLMLIGHLLSFTVVNQKKIPVAEGDRIQFDGIGDISVNSIRYDFFPESSLLRQRIRQADVVLKVDNNGLSSEHDVAFMKPAIINGKIIILDMERKKQDRIIKPDSSDENCNREQRFNYSGSASVMKPQLFILVTEDPGLIMLLPGFFIVIIIMGWYFYQTTISKKNKDFMEVENEVSNG